MAKSYELSLKSEPDGLGYIYGTLAGPNGERYRVDIMPPKPHWHGSFKSELNSAHPMDWIVYLDGEEFARVTKRDDIEPAIFRHLEAK